MLKENLVVAMMLQDDITNPEAQQLCNKIKHSPYINKITYISKEAALKEQTAAMGTDPSEFIGANPFLCFNRTSVKGDYANTDSFEMDYKELKRYPKVGNITYQQALVNSVNDNLQKISLVLLVLAILLYLRIILLINNTVRFRNLCISILNSYDETRWSVMEFYTLSICDACCCRWSDSCSCCHRCFGNMLVCFIQL